MVWFLSAHGIECAHLCSWDIEAWGIFLL